MSWVCKDTKDQLVFSPICEYLLDHTSGEKIATVILNLIDHYPIVVDLSVKPIVIHHHFYYGFLNTCIKQGRADLFTPGKNLTIVPMRDYGIQRWEHILNQYRKKGFLPSDKEVAFTDAS